MRDRSGVKEAAALMALKVLVDRITAVALRPSTGEHAAGQSAWQLGLLRFLTQIGGPPTEQRTRVPDFDEMGRKRLHV